ncbi:MAG: 3-oxoacyl-ACP reductase FabG [Oscillospiraceae bacterium]|nr:3-oxoacyl-ACP reductase FabG [Oscillospiraceae bacterium]
MKTALITGGSRGIGAACAKALQRDGYDVVITYLNSGDAAADLAMELGCRAVRCDVADSGRVKEMFDLIGPVDILVCCAGISITGLFTDVTPEEWRRIFAVNVDGTYNCIRCALPHMIHEKAGSIVTVSSIWGITGASCEAAYSATKAAIIGLTKALAKELGPSNITVNCVAPGVIDTDMNKHLTAKDIDALKDETPLGVIGTPEDIAETVSFLVSPKARFITGQVISPNGGIVI